MFLLKTLATLTILVTTLFGVDELLHYLFGNILGINFLLLAILVIACNDCMLGLYTFFLCTLLGFYYYSIQKTTLTHEGFVWSQSNIDTFLQKQLTTNPHQQYDIQTIQKYVSEEELQDYLNNGKWSWSYDTQEQYKSALSRNPYVRVDPTEGLNRAQQIYYEHAIKYILTRQNNP